MQLKEILQEAIDNVINKYTKLIASKYDIDAKELLALWDNKSQISGADVEISAPAPSEELDPVYLLKCKKPELKVLCKKRGLKCTGTKAQLIGYLQGKEPDSAKTSSSKSTTSSRTSNKSSEKKQSTLVKNIIKKVPVIAIRKNQFGNHEHPETHLVFDNKLKKVVGVQRDDGTVSSLTKTDIDICNKFKFSYVIPDNLDTGKLDDEKVEELEEEEEEEEFEEEFEEELVEDELDDDLYEEYEEYEEEVY